MMALMPSNNARAKSIRETPNSKYKMLNPRGDFSQSKTQQLISKAAKKNQQRA